LKKIHEVQMKYVINSHALLAYAMVALAVTAGPAGAENIKLGKSAVPLNTPTKNASPSALLTSQTFTVPSSVLAKTAVGNKPKPVKTTSSDMRAAHYKLFSNLQPKKPALTAVQSRIQLPASSKSKSRISRY
jgi:hypothetical protein